MTLNVIAAQQGGCAPPGRATVGGGLAAAAGVRRRPRVLHMHTAATAPWTQQAGFCACAWLQLRRRGPAPAAAGRGSGSGREASPATRDNAAAVDHLVAGVAASGTTDKSSRGSHRMKGDTGGNVTASQQQPAGDAILAPKQKSRTATVRAPNSSTPAPPSPPSSQQLPLNPNRSAPGVPYRSRSSSSNSSSSLAVTAAGPGPVMKGDLALPGGPKWSGLRRHIFAAGTDANLPTISAIVVVEGDEDQRAVAKAVNAPVYVCDGTRVLRPHAAEEVRALATLGRNVLVLTDPDERGRQLRSHLDGLLAPLLTTAASPRRLLHAFVPELSAMSSEDGPVHAAGNRGIEHTVPGVLITALRSAAPSYPAGRAVWDLQRLEALGLARPFDGGKAAQQAHRSAVSPVAAALGEPRERRRRLCAALGLGRCSGSQLVAALNRYFDERRVEAALAAVDQQLAALGASGPMGGGGDGGLSG